MILANSADSTVVKVAFFVQDYSNALQRADVLDAQILGNASMISTHYADLVALAARQAMARVETTIGTNNGLDTYNTSDVKMFMKDTGTSQYVLISSVYVT